MRAVAVSLSHDASSTSSTNARRRIIEIRESKVWMKVVVVEEEGVRKVASRIRKTRRLDGTRIETRNKTRQKRKREPRRHKSRC